MGEEEDISTAYQLSHLSHLQLVGGGGWDKKSCVHQLQLYIGYSDCELQGTQLANSIVNWEIYHLFNNKNLTHILPSSKWTQEMYGGLVWWISCQRWPSRFLCGPNGANMEVCTHWMQGMFGMRGRQYTMPGMQGLGGNIPAEPRLGETRAPKGCRASQGCSVSTMLVASFQRIPLKISKNIILMLIFNL